MSDRTDAAAAAWAIMDPNAPMPVITRSTGPRAPRATYTPIANLMMTLVHILRAEDRWVRADEVASMLPEPFRRQFGTDRVAIEMRALADYQQAVSIGSFDGSICARWCR